MESLTQPIAPHELFIAGAAGAIAAALLVTKIKCGRQPRDAEVAMLRLALQAALAGYLAADVIPFHGRWAAFVIGLGLPTVLRVSTSAIRRIPGIAVHSKETAI